MLLRRATQQKEKEFTTASRCADRYPPTQFTPTGHLRSRVLPVNCLMGAEKRWARAEALLSDTVIAVRGGVGRGVLEQYMRQIYESDGVANSVVEAAAPSTTASAREAPSYLRPLEGLPFLVKDNLDVKDFHTVCGNPLYVTRPVARRDCSIVATLRELGAIPVGKTNVPYLSMDLQTFNEVYGTTCNPCNSQRTVGGSSGGSAAAVALGLAAFSVGTDWNGSLRIPAAFCGVCSLRASRGRMTLDGRDHHLPPIAKDPEVFGHIMVQGLFARGVTDLRFCIGPLLSKSSEGCLQSSMNSCCDSKNESSIQRDKIRCQKESNTLDQIVITIGVAVPFSGLPLDCRIEEAMRKIPLWLRESKLNVDGAKLEAVVTNKLFLDFSEIRKAMKIFSLNLASMRTLDSKEHLAKLDWAKGVQSRSLGAVESFLERAGFSAVIVPVLPPSHNYQHAAVLVNGVDIPYFWAMGGHVEPFSVSGNPVVTMPLCWIEGKPCGIQVIGKMGDDERLLQICEQMERYLHVEITDPKLQPVS